MRALPTQSHRNLALRSLEETEPLSLSKLLRRLAKTVKIAGLVRRRGTHRRGATRLPVIVRDAFGRGHGTGCDSPRSLSEWGARALLERALLRIQYKDHRTTMSESGCTNNECTFAQTGICLLDHPPDECPHWVSGHETALDGDASPTHGDPVLVPLEDSSRFPPSAVLGMDDVRALMGKECCRLIGLLGDPDSGKTACLVSLYLLLAHDRPQWLHLRR